MNINTSKSKYQDIAKYGRSLASSADYIVEQQRLAEKEGAPIDALYRKQGGTWRTQTEVDHDLMAWRARQHRAREVAAIIMDALEINPSADCGVAAEHQCVKLTPERLLDLLRVPSNLPSQQVANVTRDRPVVPAAADAFDLLTQEVEELIERGSLSINGTVAKRTSLVRFGDTLKDSESETEWTVVR